MSVEIRETIVTQDASGDVVQLDISDAELDDESATFRLTILATLHPLQTASLAHYQREAMRVAQDNLTDLLKRLAGELHDFGQPLDPRQKGRTL